MLNIVWQNKFSELQKFKKEHDHTNPANTAGKEFKGLAKWCFAQKSFHKEG